MSRRVPDHWFTSAARPLSAEPPRTIEPTLELAALPPSSADGPEPFGRKCAWLAIRCQTTATVLEALGILRSAACGWRLGLETAHREAQVVFLTPPLDGWTLVAAPLARFYDDAVGREAHLAWLRDLSQRLGEVQHFASHRSVTHFSWSRAVGGRIVRACQFSEDPNRCWSVGVAEEGEGGTPDEDRVLTVARRWSVDPDALSATPASPSKGTLGLLPPTAVHVLVPSAYQRDYPEQPAEAPTARTCCRVYWNPGALQLGYEFEPVADRGPAGNVAAVGPRRRVGEFADVPRIVAALRAALASKTARGRSHGRSKHDVSVRLRGDEVVVEVEQADGMLRFWPTRRRFGRVRRHQPELVECRWADRAGIVAWSLDEAIVRSMRLRPLWRILVELGQP